MTINIQDCNINNDYFHFTNNLDNLSSFGRLLSKDFGNTTENSKLKVI